MEQIIQKILEIDPVMVWLAVLFFMFVPGSFVVRIRKLNRWVKTIAVLMFGELGAIVLWVLSEAAKAANADSFLKYLTEFAIILAVMMLGYAIAGHVLNWDHRILKGLKRKDDQE